MPFFDSIARNDIVVDSGTWRSGKSFELCLFLILRMKSYPGIREFLGRKTLKSLKETTFLKFQEILIDHFNLIEGRDYFVNRSSNPQVSFPNGSSCVFGDLEVNTVGKWMSAEYSDIGIDEAQEISQLSFEKIKSRQAQTVIERLSIGRQKNKFVMAMNPPEIADQHWTHRRFRDPATKIKNSCIIFSNIDNNRENIPETYIEDMYDSVDSRTADIYLKGLWVPMLSKTVYSDYSFPKDSNGNYIEGGNLKACEYNKNLESYIFMDFGWTHAMSIGWVQYDRMNDTYYRLYEFVESYVKPEKYCELLATGKIEHNGKRYEAPFTSKQAAVIVGIEASQSRQEADGKSNLALMREYLGNLGSLGNIYTSSPGLQESILTVRNHVLSATGKRRIFIDLQHCRKFIDDSQSYHYPVNKDGNVKSEEPEKDGIVDNTQDEMRYGVAFISPIVSHKIMVQKR